MGWLDKYQRGGEVSPKAELISLPHDINPIKDNNLKIAYANSKGLDEQQLSGFENQDDSYETWRNNRDSYYGKFRQDWINKDSNSKFSQTAPEYMSMIEDMKSSWFDKNQRPINDVVLDYRQNGPKNPNIKLGDNIDFKGGVYSNTDIKKRTIPFKAQHGSEPIKKLKGSELKSILDDNNKRRIKENDPPIFDTTGLTPRTPKEVEALKLAEERDRISKIVDDRENARFAADNNPLNSWDKENLLTFNNLTRENLSAVGKGLESQFRVSDAPNFFDDYVNPLNMIGGMAANLGQAPLEAQQNNSALPYVTSIGTPLVVGALGGIGTQNTGQFINNVVNPLAGIKETVKNIPSLNTIKKVKNF